MTMPALLSQLGRRRNARGFSLPELLVVIGILSLLVAIMLPPLFLAQHQAKQTRCAAQQQQLGFALESTRTDTQFYPTWDDQGAPERYSWIDVLAQRGALAGLRSAECPADPQPGVINAARGTFNKVTMRTRPGMAGVDYSYGISVPLAAAGWTWTSATPQNDVRPRRLEGYDKGSAERLLTADASWTYVYNLSGDGQSGHEWSYPSQYDNTVDWRHPRLSANILYQDLHVANVRYRTEVREAPVNTAVTYVWHRGESVHVNSEDRWGDNWYPNVPAVDLRTGENFGSAYPSDLAPGFYTHHNAWTVFTE